MQASEALAPPRSLLAAFVGFYQLSAKTVQREAGLGYPDSVSALFRNRHKRGSQDSTLIVISQALRRLTGYAFTPAILHQMATEPGPTSVEALAERMGELFPAGSNGREP